jgi:hypothetical protein
MSLHEASISALSPRGGRAPAERDLQPWGGSRLTCFATPQRSRSEADLKIRFERPSRFLILRGGV